MALRDQEVAQVLKQEGLRERESLEIGVFAVCGAGSLSPGPAQLPPPVCLLLEHENPGEAIKYDKERFPLFHPRAGRGDSQCARSTYLLPEGRWQFPSLFIPVHQAEDRAGQALL